MVRTNLSYLEQFYETEQRTEDVTIKSFSKGKRPLMQNENASRIMLIKEGITKCFFTEEK